MEPSAAVNEIAEALARLGAMSLRNGFVLLPFMLDQARLEAEREAKEKQWQ